MMGICNGRLREKAGMQVDKRIFFLSRADFEKLSYPWFRLSVGCNAQKRMEESKVTWSSSFFLF